MDTGTVVAIALAILFAAVVAWLFLKGKSSSGELPESPAKKPGEGTSAVKPAASEARPKADAKPAEAAKKAEAKKAPKAEAKKPSPADEAAPEAPAEEAEAPAEEEPAAEAPAEAEPAAREASEEDVKALKKGLASTRGGFIARLAKLFGKKTEIDPELLDEIQEVLITADIGVKTSERILERLKTRMDNDQLGDEDQVWEALREEARGILEAPGTTSGGVYRAPSESPGVILVVGVNGVGKTTTIGKLASRFQENGKKVILAAGDTFRAAAVLQLEVWGRRVGCDVVKGKERADPASVIFDAIKKAREEDADYVIADTAGRLHTKTNLMEELKKVVRSAEKALERPVDEILLVLDSTTGQNAIQQAQLFKDAIEVSGIALTKLDGTAKGGVILGIVDEHGLPVHFVGIGERVEDLREFDAPSFVEALFAKPDDETLAA